MPKQKLEQKSSKKVEPNMIDDEFGIRRDTPPAQRHQGDGAAIVEDHNESLKKTTMCSEASKRYFTFNIQLDTPQILLFIIALATRLWKLGYPRAVVFDELLFGRYALFYMRKMFYFDLNPPLGQQLLALVGLYSGLEDAQDFTINKIGKAYPPHFPVYQMRLLPAVCGCLLVPLSYQILIELGFSQFAGIVAACLILFDNALLTQSRFMLMEPMMLFACCISLLSLLKFRKCVNKSFGIEWWCWLGLMGISATCAMAIKYVGAFTFLLILVIVCVDYWRILANLSVSYAHLLYHVVARILCLVIVPTAVYLGIFYIHLTTLTKAGPTDIQMTSAFQTSLEGGLAAITKNQPYEIAYGSQITLRRTYGDEPCWLHSHKEMYPVRYDDKRGSSHQQQVTCYVFKDHNNWWIVKDPERGQHTIDVPPKPVRHGDVIELVHGITGRKLNSHDVSAPLSKELQEVSCYVNYNVSMPPQLKWRVEILNHIDGDSWKTIRSNVRFIHVTTNAVLKATDRPLPSWGHHQKECVTDKMINQDAAVWNVEEHKYGEISSNAEEREAALKKLEFIPTRPTEMGFFEKFWEVQTKLITSPIDAKLEHKYSTSPLEWPFLEKNIAYWLHPSSNAQIHLLGNPVIWYSGTISVVVYLAVLVYLILRRQRQCYDINDDTWSHFVFVGQLLLGGYLMHYLPYFMTSRTMFLHSYLPALFYQILLLAATMEISYKMLRYPALRMAFKIGFALWSVAVLYSFYELSVFTYGVTSLPRAKIDALSWKETWDFLAYSHLP